MKKEYALYVGAALLGIVISDALGLAAFLVYLCALYVLKDRLRRLI